MHANGREVVIVEAVRTPIGARSPGEGLLQGHPSERAARPDLHRGDRAGGHPADAVEDVIRGCVQQYGEQMFNVGRNAWLQAGLPVETPPRPSTDSAASAQQAFNFGAALIAAGVHDVVIGGGVEHMGHIPMGIASSGSTTSAHHGRRSCSSATTSSAGHLGRDDRRQVGDSAVGDG